MSKNVRAALKTSEGCCRAIQACCKILEKTRKQEEQKEVEKR